ncbi:hypothetical protein JX266_014241 [Neoarthrinium moseri]|nr:hypothetical protein JX266_014241 [Neoarthrinium moseri]
MEFADKITYSHLPTETIRLLRLHEDPTSDYCWGRDPQSKPLRLTGGTIFINPNLAAAISCLQKLASDEVGKVLWVQYIWIDKICIDQNNVSERSAQVGLMGHIYSQSIRTLIRLGFGIDECCDAWHLVDDIYHICMKQNPDVKSIADIPLKLYSEEHHADFGLPDLAHEHWKSLSTLLSDPWFTRIWVFRKWFYRRRTRSYCMGDIAILGTVWDGQPRGCVVMDFFACRNSQKHYEMLTKCQIFVDTTGSGRSVPC